MDYQIILMRKVKVGLRMSSAAVTMCSRVYTMYTIHVPENIKITTHHASASVWSKVLSRKK